MNPKNSRKNQTKSTPKKKTKSNVKSTPIANDVKSKFYSSKDGGELSEHQKVIDQKKVTAEEPKKLERSNSFYLTRKLSKIYTKLSGSKENLDKAKEGEKAKKEEATPPYKFQRSLTLNSFQLKKGPRKSFLDSKLEKLSEEKICENGKAKSPPLSPTPVLRSKSPASYRQSLPPGSLDGFDFLMPPPPKLERSGSFISLIKRKISFNEPSPMKSNWATSLQSLQQIDNMVSYEDLSFVDYDKFNQYEQQIDKMLSRIHNDSVDSPALQMQHSIENSVVRRRPKKVRVHSSDINSNLDREKNLYRQSIDSSKLQFLSSINSDSHRWSTEMCDNDPMNWLSLENTPQAVNPNV
ncbi:CLUMA_CG016750, isoform A [Clunio marinus]|uniref:CLUMA_CG016750, isoform A n=1 Tax=Clunio marinus TaxID=568069 RepID=A0A1J1ITP8_9DIPT|nr:CLUMA_CG016750, isoform A [Clunio marinus]